MMIVALLAMLSQASVGSQAIAQPPSPTTPAGITTPTPLGDPASWVTPQDYPGEALHNGQQGIVGFRAAVDARGNVTGCTVTRSSGTASLDEATCHLVQARAHFSPARDARKRAVSDSFTSRVKWVIPAGPELPARRPIDLPAPDSPNVLVVSYILEADGTHTDCRIERAEGKANEASHVGSVPCFGARSREGYVDAQGKPERRRVTLTMSTSVDPVR